MDIDSVACMKVHLSGERTLRPQARQLALGGDARTLPLGAATAFEGRPWSVAYAGQGAR